MDTRLWFIFHMTVMVNVLHVQQDPVLFANISPVAVVTMEIKSGLHKLRIECDFIFIPKQFFLWQSGSIHLSIQAYQ